MLGALLSTYSLAEVRHHAGRHATALLAVVLGVALAFSVHLINLSALSEFSAAVRSVNGAADFELRGARGGLAESLYPVVAEHPMVAHASPVVEVEAHALDAQGRRVPLRMLGIDALAAMPLSPALVPALAPGQDRMALFSTDGVSLNAAARARLGLEAGARLRVQVGLDWLDLPVHGSVSAPGGPLAVMDIAGAQGHFQSLGRLTRIDVKLADGADRERLLAGLRLPADVRAVTPDESELRVSNVSRAYRVNLTVLSLVALFTGAFLVYSVLALSVAKRQQQFALLGVLGLTARERLRLVLYEAAVLGVVGSAIGLLAGTGIASLALQWLAGDLGGGYFPGIQPRLQFSWPAALVYGTLGVAAAGVGGYLPARQAARLVPAQALKGLGEAVDAGAGRWLAPLMLVVGAGLALLPPVAGMPVFAYLSVAALLIGGIACVPAAVALLVHLAPAGMRRSPMGLLALERARRMRQSATVAVAGVVASLSLAVALTVMVASFRASVSSWLDTVLPADLYARTASSTSAADSAYLPADFVQAVAALPGVARLESVRLVSLSLDAARPNVAVLSRPLNDPAANLPLIGDLLDAPAGQPAAYVSEAMVSLYGARPGTTLELPLQPDRAPVAFFVRGVWRDYARQHGAVVLDTRDFIALTGDRRVNDLALWLDPQARTDAVQAAIRQLASQPDTLEFADPRDIRQASLRIFDRSFAVTYWLQAVAIGIGLFGVAASFSAQVLARRKEFGLLQHLGFTRTQVLGIVTGEGVAWTAAGALLGLVLGLAVSVVLVHVVNPQSFHWTMDLLLPWLRLAVLCAAVIAAGTLTAVLAGRAAVGRQAVLAVKEDW